MALANLQFDISSDTARNYGLRPDNCSGTGKRYIAIYRLDLAK